MTTQENLLPLDNSEPQIDENKNYLEELVGEGKKFKSPEDLAKGKWHSDQTIEVMKQRMDELRADYLKLREENTSQANLKELVDQLKTQLASSKEPLANEDHRDTPKFDPKDLDVLVSNKVRELDLSKKQEENFNNFRNKLAERFGTNENALNQQINQLGLDKEDLVNLAKKSPTAALKALGLDQQQQHQDGFQSPPRSNQRNDSFAPTNVKKRTWSYYQELRKANPTAWHDPKTGAQMAKDATELGDAFYDGDFYVKGLHEK